MKREWPLDTALSFDPYFGEPDRDGEQGYEILPDGKVRLCVKAPGAQRVVLDQFGTEHPLRKTDAEMWSGEVDLGRGFQYFFLKIDGADVLCPYLPIGYGCCRPMHFFDIPVPGEEWGALAGTAHGSVNRHYFYSEVTGKEEICLVYTPASYDPGKQYPVLYLQHGYGENETGWVYQGRVNRIADELLKDGRMQEMLIVMACGMTTEKDRAVRDPKLFTEVLVRDLIPYIESRYPVRADKWSRAMAGLSMGSFQTAVTTMSHPELFGYAGIFSGFLRFPLSDGKNSHLEILDDPARFNQSFRVFYRAMGTEDLYFDNFTADDALLDGKPLHVMRKLFPGGHDWGVWRRCIHDFLPLIFKE